MTTTNYILVEAACVTGTVHCWLERGIPVSSHFQRFMWASRCRAAGLLAHRLLRGACGSSGENHLWPSWLSNLPPGSQGEGAALQGIGCNWCEEGGSPAGVVGTWKGGTEGKPVVPERTDEGSGLCPPLCGSGLDPRSGSMAETVGQSLDCSNCWQHLLNWLVN